jgi:regulatory protein YycI of two-component signal transduction system YycFG
MSVNEAGEEEPLNLDDAPIPPKRRDFGGAEKYRDAFDAYKIDKKAWDKKLKASFDLIKFQGKIYILLETVPKETLAMLKTTMSHDKPRIWHKYVDDKGRVRNVVLEGAPAFIFCSIDEFYYAEFATRVVSDTPDTTEAKIRAVKKMIAQKYSFPWDFKPTQERTLIKALIRNIRDTINKFNLKFLNPFPNCDELIGGISVRDMRDFGHFEQLLSAKPILSLFQRPIVTIEGEKFFVATVQDFINAEKHFKLVYETTQTNTDKRTLTFYHEYVQHHINGATLKTIVDHIFDPENSDMNYKGETKPTSLLPPRSTARRYLGRLSDLGWVDVHEEEQADKRELTFYPLKDVTATEIQAKIVETTLDKPIEPDLKAKLLKDFELWKKTISNRGSTYTLTKINFNDRKEVPITEEEFDKIIIGVNEPPLAIVLNQESSPETQNNPEANTNQPIDADTLISKPEKPIEMCLIERLQATLAFVNEGCRKEGMILKTTVPDQEILSKLILEGMVFEPKEGYVKDV